MSRKSVSFIVIGILAVIILAIVLFGENEGAVESEPNTQVLTVPEASVEAPPAESGEEEVIEENTDVFVSWEYVNGVWEAKGNPPACPEKIIAVTPVDVSLATSILYPGQTRSNDYKAHGGFRFDTSDNDAIVVRLPQDAYVFRGSRHTQNGEVQYSFDFIHPCGILYRLDHLLTLSDTFAAFAETLPLPTDDSRQYSITPVRIPAGTIVASAVGFKETDNVFFDFGVYDVREKNSAASREGEFASYGLCWLDLLPEADRETVYALPGGDGIVGTTSDYC